MISDTHLKAFFLAIAWIVVIITYSMILFPNEVQSASFVFGLT